MSRYGWPSGRWGLARSANARFSVVVDIRLERSLVLVPGHLIVSQSRGGIRSLIVVEIVRSAAAFVREKCEARRTLSSGLFARSTS